jgi:hypothetical protein
MGDFSKSMSQRIKHTRIKTGYCLICGDYGDLTKDHVPPKGSITIEPIEQRHIMELMSSETTKLKGVKANHGSTFKTICSQCNNNALGRNDCEISRVNTELTKLIKNKYYQYNGTPNTIHIDIDALKYSRAMIGHILAATSVTDCQKEPTEAPYFSPLQKFVLGEDSAIELTHDIHYWFYPHRRHLSAKLVSFSNEGANSLISLLSFFPIAFLVSEKDKGIWPAHAVKLNTKDKKLSLSLSMHNSEYIEFPFCTLKGNQFMALTDHQCIMSYPIGTK